MHGRWGALTSVTPDGTGQSLLSTGFWCVVYSLPASAFSSVLPPFQGFTPYFQGSGFSGRVHQGGSGLRPVWGPNSTGFVLCSEHQKRSSVHFLVTAVLCAILARNGLRSHPLSIWPSKECKRQGTAHSGRETHFAPYLCRLDGIMMPQ